MDCVPIAEAARRMGVSVDTVKRRLRNGELQGYKQPGRGGFSWLIEMDDSSPSNSSGNTSANATVNAPANDGETQALRELVDTLRSQVTAQQNQLESYQQQFEAKDRQIEQLHVLLQQAQAALPAPRENHRSWWRFWQR
jgi:excisionase family DNA binding protein